MDIDTTIKMIGTIRENLSGFFAEGKIIVQPHSYKGINLKIVSPKFPSTYEERVVMVNRILEKLNLDLNDSIFQFVELLTPEEDELFGTDLNDLAPENLPFWSNTVFQYHQKEKLRFRDIDVEESFSSPNIVTFYSFKGGVGRSTALACAALTLADKGRTVIVVDMDLEAPALIDLFNVDLTTERQKGGLVELMNRLDAGEMPDVREYLVSVTDSLYLLPAGKISPYYIQQLSLIDPRRYYRLERNPVKLMFEMLESLDPKPDVVLVDARTGLTDISAPLLLEISDMSVLVFYPHPQVKDGLDLLVRGILSRRNRRDLTSEVRFVLSPIPESDRKQPKIQHLGIDWVRGYVEQIGEYRNSYGQPSLEMNTEEIVHAIYYNEQMANASKITIDEKLLSPYSKIVEWIDALLDPQEELQSKGDESGRTKLKMPTKKEVLEEMDIHTGIAENQHDLSSAYVKTSDYRRATKERICLIVGRKGTGKTALFRMLQHEFGDRSVVVRNSVPDRNGLDLESEEFADVEKQLPEKDWRLYWAATVLFHLYRDSRYKKYVSEALDKAVLIEFQQAISQKEKSLKENWLVALNRILRQPALGSKLFGAFQRINGSLEKSVILLWDGLDRGFGYEEEAKKRQQRVIIGILDFWVSVDKLDRFQLKVFLRHDIWKRLAFQNKSHLYGRRLDLKWRNKHEYYKTLLKQIYRGKARNYFNIKYKEYKDKEYSEVKEKNLPEEVEDWTDEQVTFVFNLLAGERMRGGKSAFTINWVWSRLADGNDDHSPRYLFQLFRTAVDFECEEQQPYEKSLIRPRILMKSLGPVSNEAVSALIDEEYQELGDPVGKLKNTKVPFSYETVKDWDEDLLRLAFEVGLFKVYEEDKGKVLRITVPDLYLKGLGMFRRGQA